MDPDAEFRSQEMRYDSAPTAIAPITTPMRSGAGHRLARTTRSNSGMRCTAGQRAWKGTIHQHRFPRSGLEPAPPSSTLDVAGASTVNDPDTPVPEFVRGFGATKVYGGNLVLNRRA